MPTLITNNTASNVFLTAAYFRQELLPTEHTVVQDDKAKVDVELAGLGLTTSPVGSLFVTPTPPTEAVADIVGLAAGSYARYDTTAGNFNQTFPLAAGNSGSVIYIENATGANAVTAVAAGADSIVGTAAVATLTIAAFVSDGVDNWTRLALD